MNTSGYCPLGDRVLVLPEAVEETTKGGIALPREYVEREGMAQIRVKVVAIGPLAWANMTSGPWVKVGQTALISKWAGLIYTGKDKEKYRVINDVDLVAVEED